MRNRPEDLAPYDQLQFFTHEADRAIERSEWIIAMVALRRLTELRGSEQDWVRLAKCYEVQNQFDRASAAFRKALDRYPASRSARLGLERVRRRPTDKPRPTGPTSRYQNHCWKCAAEVDSSLKRCGRCRFFVCSACAECLCGDFRRDYECSGCHELMSAVRPSTRCSDCQAQRCGACRRCVCLP